MVKGATREPFALRIAKGYGYLFISQVMSLFINFSVTALLSRFTLLLIFACACTLLLTLGMQFNWAYNCAKIDEVLDRQKIKPYDRLMPLKMSLCTGIVPVGLYVVLVLSRIGVIGNFLPWYTLLSMWQMPFRTLFSASTEIADISIPVMIVFGLLSLLIPATGAVTYILIKRGTDFSAIVYKKNIK
jgi:hypothetical protein